MYVLPGGNAAFGTKPYGVVSGAGGEIHYVPLDGQKTNAPSYVYNPDGSYNRTEYNSHIMGYAKGIGTVVGAALGAGAAFGGAAAGGAAAGATGEGIGAANALSDAAAYNSLTPAAWESAGLGSTVAPATGTLGAGAGLESVAPATGGLPPPANPFNLGSYLNPGNLGNLAMSTVGAGVGSGGWTSMITPALQAIGGAYTANQAGKAAQSQVDAANAGIDESRRQFDTVRQLLAPYVIAGTDSLGGYRGLAGVDGPQAQQSAITALQGTPQFGNLVQQGENAILQNAAATGGLRGGNTQNSLANYRTNVLSGLIDQQLNRYGSLINTGQNAAAGTGNAAMTTGTNVSNLLGQAGAAQAGGTIASTNAVTNALGGIGGFLAAGGTAPTNTYTPQTQQVMTTQFGTGIVPSYGFQPRAF
jgi:hypothetical protein